MAPPAPFRFRSITEYCRLTNFPAPAHPLLTVLDLTHDREPPAGGTSTISLVADFYFIALKQGFTATLHYGQQTYDFAEGVLSFIAPNQIFSFEFGPEAAAPQGWLLLLHPDFLWNTPLAAKMTRYDYFSYAVHEALHLAEAEQQQLTAVVRQLAQEVQRPLDRASQDILVAHLDLLLAYAERFYQRQFLTRRMAGHQLLQRLEQELTAYFGSELLARSGLPTVQYLADRLHVSPGYLGSLLHTLTGQRTQQHIHDKLIEQAKLKLSTTSLTVSEIAYDLGFEHPQSFSRLFKAKTSQAPLAFRQAFGQ